MLTIERAERLVGILESDEERAVKLLELDAEVALEQINTLGNDFTIDELREFGEALTAVAKNEDELDA